MVYNIPREVNWMHDKVPRFDARQGMKTVSNTFGADVTGDDLPYYTAVVSVAGAYFAIGIVTFLIFALVYASYGCCRPRFRAIAKGGCCSRFVGWLVAPRLWYVAAAGAMLAGTSAALSQVSLFRTATDKSVAGFNGFADIVSGASTTTSGMVNPTLAAAAAALASLSAAVTTNSATDLVTPVADFNTLLTTVRNAATDAGTQLSSLDGMLNDIRSTGTHDGDFNLNELGYNVWRGGIAALAIFLGFVALTLPGMSASRCGARWHRMLNACGLTIASLLVFVFAGIFILVSLLGSDICVAPSAALVDIANATSRSLTVQESLAYYTTCGGAAPPLAPAGIYGIIVEQSSHVADALSGVTAMQAIVTSHAPDYDFATPFLTQLGGNMTAASGHVTHLSSQLTCAPIAAVYASLLDALCVDGMVAVIRTWGLATAACVLVYILVSAGARLCWSHPGDPVDPEAEKRAAAEAAAAAHGIHGAGGAPQMVGAAPKVAGGGGSAASYA